MVAMGIKTIGFALCMNAVFASTDKYPWPDMDVGPKTPERFSAAKRLSRLIPCTVCRLRLQGTILKNVADEEALEQLLEKDFLSDHEGGVSAFCGMSELKPLLQYFGITVKLYADGSAELFLAREGDKNVSFYDESAIEPDIHWISHGISQSCMDIFRRNLDWMAAAVSDAYETIKGKASKANPKAESEEAWATHVRSSIQEACQNTKACKRQNLEESLDISTRRRDRARALADPDFHTNASDFWIPNAVDFDVQVDYYKILGVDQFALEAKMRDNYNVLVTHERAYLQMADLSSNTESSEKIKAVLAELSQALLVLTNRVSRRQFDRARDKLDLEVPLGLVDKRKKDKDCFDGHEAMKKIGNIGARQEL